MSVSRVRARYLSAIGAIVPTLAMSACKDPPAQVATAEGGQASTTPTRSAEPLTGSAVASTPEAGPTAPRFNMPSCPSGAFCVSETANLAAKDAAPAPYAKCALTTKHPEDATDSGWVGRSRSVSFNADNTRAERTKTPSACCYTWVIPCPGGRAFRDATGTISVARTMGRGDWTAALGALETADLATDARAVLAERWTREAAFEHASIASFAQLTLDLLALSAPPELLVETQRAALDEIGHAQIAFALATAYGGTPVGPAGLAALPGASRSLPAIARTTFVDGCIGESIASVALAEESRATVDPVLRDALATMAEDEERHAELAWRIVAWALRSGDPEVGRALAAAQADVIAELVALPGNALRKTVLREIVLPCSSALLADSDTVATTLGGHEVERDHGFRPVPSGPIS